MTLSVATQLPIKSGFRMPAEWEPHAATWLSWPQKRSDWPGKLSPIPWVYAEIVRLLSKHERIQLLVNDLKWEQIARRYLTKAGVDLQQITFWKHPTDRVWTRDYGPLFLINSKNEQAYLDWHFNGWAKYSDWEKDDGIPRKVGRKLKLPCWQPTFNGKRVVLEGGSIDVNGQG